MSKQGILISVAEDQEGASPEIVTDDRPLPISGAVETDTSASVSSLEVLQELKEYIAHSLFEQKLTNNYLAIIYGEDLREDLENEYNS